MTDRPTNTKQTGMNAHREVKLPPSCSINDVIIVTTYYYFVTHKVIPKQFIDGLTVVFTCLTWCSERVIISVVLPNHCSIDIQKAFKRAIIS